MKEYRDFDNLEDAEKFAKLCDTFVGEVRRGETIIYRVFYYAD